MTQPRRPNERGARLVCAQLHEVSPWSDAPADEVGFPVVIRIDGDIDLTTVGGLSTRLRSVLSGSGCRTLILDLEDLEFLSAGGVSVLLAALHRAREAGQVVRVRNANGSPARVLRLLGLASWCREAGFEVRQRSLRSTADECR